MEDVRDSLAPNGNGRSHSRGRAGESESGGIVLKSRMDVADGGRSRSRSGRREDKKKKKKNGKTSKKKKDSSSESSSSDSD